MDRIEYSWIQYNTKTVQYNTVQYNTIQHNAVQYNTAQYSTLRTRTVSAAFEQHAPSCPCPILANGHCTVAQACMGQWANGPRVNCDPAKIAERAIYPHRLYLRAPLTDSRVMDVGLAGAEETSCPGAQLSPLGADTAPWARFRVRMPTCPAHLPMPTCHTILPSPTRPCKGPRQEGWRQTAMAQEWAMAKEWAMADGHSRGHIAAGDRQRLSQMGKSRCAGTPRLALTSGLFKSST